MKPLKDNIEYIQKNSSRRLEELKECMDMDKKHPKRLGRQKPIIIDDGNDNPPCEACREVIDTDGLPGDSPENPIWVEEEERGD